MASAPGASLPPLALLLLLLTLAPSPSSAAAPARQCAYTLRVKTSCASPARTSDAISVAFGDAYRNEAHAPRLPTTSPSTRALEPCGTDTFRVQGTCGYGVCYLYLRREGRDGWTPDWVQVIQPGPRGAAPATATFYFGDPLANGVWYGHDRCPKTKPAADAEDEEHAAARPATTATADDARRATNSSASPRG
ncbi:unnamed protein product [Urochloa humidicola]